jgi:hypothetical protein
MLVSIRNLKGTMHPLLDDLLLYSQKADIIQGLLKNDIKLARSLNFTFRYIDDVLSLSNSGLVTLLVQ